MPAQQLEIDNSTVFDNVDERQVEFDGEVDGEEYQFAVQYSVLTALTGDQPDGDAESSFRQHIDTIRDAGLAALSNGPDRPTIVISESDLDR
ncbi:DUF1488 family protein [Sphingomonas sp. JC676]|uniref:DUF1488 family protein n=1 Tax=Sphingomonas sp. JC676 TaxID=2768065 RepID=UPI0016583C0D|nr:DUF1488 family protein [Sphingomonas sp. JC676]MBC9030850.1 DUF1488 family protein [Sphingomonas sp. JC676]